MGRLFFQKAARFFYAWVLYASLIMNVVAIVPAAGSGMRMQHAGKKPYIELQGRTILAHTLSALNQAECIGSIIIAVHPGDEQHCRTQVLSGLELRPHITIVDGGERRQDSVSNALAQIPGDCDVVLIHDGARPFVTPDILEETAAAAWKHGAATAAVPLKDTVMRLDDAEKLYPEPLKRDTLFAIQTPQAFRPDIIIAAHAHARSTSAQATDDASLVRPMGLPVAISAGSYDNIKITTPVDLIYGAAILQARYAKSID
jgi:2-C-methyl-D-erythritol 4-phosphate cytidylyltransferase